MVLLDFNFKTNLLQVNVCGLEFEVNFIREHICSPLIKTNVIPFFQSLSPILP